jgi:transglutaminase-like putative cysteine protease
MSGRRNAPPVTTLGSLWLVTGLALVQAPHLLRFPLGLALLCLLAMGWRVARDLRGWPLPPTWLRLTLTLGGMASVFFAYRTLLGQEAGVALLAIMLGLKLVEMTTLRDAMVVVLLAYFLAAAGFLFDQSLLAGGYLLGTVVVLTAALMVLNHPGARRDLTRDYLRRSTSLLLQALPLMAVLFVFFPRIQELGWGLTTTPSARTGLSGEMNLGDVSQLSDSREVAFRVEFQGAPPPAGSWYWRGPVLWHTDGRRWTLLPPSGLRELPHPFSPRGAPLDYTVSLPGDTTDRWLPALDIPSMVPERAFVTTDLQLFRRDRAQGTLRYPMRSYPRFQWLGLSDAQRLEALSLPPGSHPRAVALGEEWAARLPDPGKRVAEALRYFREGPFRYTRRPPPLVGDPVDQFLFETRKGFCEHYAASFVVLMRAAHLPARIVTGYEGGEYNPVGSYWVVRQSDAHAWAEVYLEEKGWVRVDPTAVIPPGRIDQDALADVTGGREGREAPSWIGAAVRAGLQGLDSVNFLWNRWVADYSAERQQDLLSRFGFLSWGAAGIAAALLVGGAVAVGAALWFTGRARRRPDPALLLYQRFCRKLARGGLGRRRNEGEQAYARRVVMQRPDLAVAVRTITALYLEARYGRPAVSLLPQLRGAVAAFRP